MSVIDSKKLLPPSKKGGSIEKQKFLVPLQNISVKKISAGDLKPVDKELKTTGNLVGVRRKITELSVLFKDSYLIDKKERETKRKEEERRKSEQRERKLEKKVKDNKVSSNLIPSIPGQSIFDRINRFIGFTLLGYLFNKYGELLPKLIEFGKVLKPVAEFIESFAKNLLSGVINFVEFGYKAYDGTRNFVKELGGEGAAKTFDDFSKQLNLLLNGAIAASMLIISSSPKKPGGPIKPGAKPSTLPKNAKLSGYLGRDPQTKMIERRYGNDAARMYESRKAQGATVSRARADVLKRFEKLEGPQRGLGGGTGQGSILSRGVGKSANRAALKVLGKTGTRIAKGVFGRVPIIGGLLDFAFSLAMGENPGRAAAKAVGATVGSALGTFIPVPFAGTILGGILGDIVGGALYDSLIGSGEKPQGRAEGGRITRGGQSSVASSRRLKTRTKKVTPRIQPQKTQPGKDVGGKLKIEELYGKDEPGTRSALRALKKSSEDVKKMRSINGLTGSMFGAGIDMALGQKPDKKLAKSIGDVFGSVVQNAVDLELNKSFGDISKTIAMAGGGAVPTREIGRQLSIGERIGKFISNALTTSIESTASKILQNLNRELNLQGGPPGRLTGDGVDGGGPPGDFSGDVKAMKAFNYFKSQGYTDFQSAAIVGNLLQENRQMNPRLENSIGMRGIAQWDANRWSNLEKFAASKKIDPYSFETQLQFIQHELRTGDGGLSASVFKNTKNLEEATVMFRKKYERPGEAEANDAKRIEYARGVLQSTRFEYVPPGKVTPVVTGRFGEMRETGRHGGSDLAVNEGTPLRAISDGKIIESGYEPGWGNYTVFTDKNGIYHLYGHMRSRGRGKGSIKKGDILGYVGMTGRTSGPHLHWETGTGWNGTITGAFDPLNRFSLNAPFNTQKDTIQDKNKPSDIFNWNQSSVAPSQSSAVASLNKSGILKEDTSTFIYNNNAVAILPIEVAAGVA